MDDLIRFDENNQTISARELHEKLNINTPYTMWFQRMCEYGFTEGIDFFTKMLESSGGRPTDNPADYQFRVRLTQDDKTKLSECADKLKINKSDVIRRGIDVIHKGLSE